MSTHFVCLTGTEVEQALLNMFTFSKESHLRAKSEVTFKVCLWKERSFVINTKFYPQTTPKIFFVSKWMSPLTLFRLNAQEEFISYVKWPQGVFCVLMNQKCVIFCIRFKLLRNYSGFPKETPELKFRLSSFFRSVTVCTSLTRMRDYLSLMSTWHGVMADEEKFMRRKISTNTVYNTLKRIPNIHTAFAVDPH